MQTPVNGSVVLINLGQSRQRRISRVRCARMW